ncbi:MAG: HAD-IIIA family hydrolase [Chloroflexi bacterium]|nr:HAD-IIIA family hydrolase [Chloroflexota bacterium]
MSNKKPAIFLDRDGVINHNRPDYVKTWDEFVFLPNVFVPFRRIAKSKYLVVIISNQSPIGHGIVQKAVVDEINMLMSAEIERHKGRVDAIYYCPHAPEDHCDCRKPEPGMFFRPRKSWALT